MFLPIQHWGGLSWEIRGFLPDIQNAHAPSTAVILKVFPQTGLLAPGFHYTHKYTQAYTLSHTHTHTVACTLHTHWMLMIVLCGLMSVIERWCSSVGEETLTTVIGMKTTRPNPAISPKPPARRLSPPSSVLLFASLALLSHSILSTLSL